MTPSSHQERFPNANASSPCVESLLLNLVGDDLPETFRLLGPNDSRRRKRAILRGKAIEHLSNAAARAFVEQQQALLATGDLVEHMHGTATLRAGQQRHGTQKIFQDKCKTLHETGAYTSLEILLNAFCGAALEQHGGRTPSFKTVGSSICWATMLPTHSGHYIDRLCASTTLLPA